MCTRIKYYWWETIGHWASLCVELNSLVLLRGARLCANLPLGPRLPASTGSGQSRSLIPVRQDVRCACSRDSVQVYPSTCQGRYRGAMREKHDRRRLHLPAFHLAWVSGARQRVPGKRGGASNPLFRGAVNPAHPGPASVPGARPAHRSAGRVPNVALTNPGSPRFPVPTGSGRCRGSPLPQ